MDKISVLILTHNEEKNIKKCLESILPLTKSVYIVDSGSDDKTVEVARGYGAEVAFHKWTTYADQLNWGLDNFDFKTDWIMRMDADEEITEGLVRALHEFLAAPPQDVSGVYVRRRVYFLGRWIRHGGYYPTWLLRVFRKGVGRCEALWMDEHIIVSSGRTVKIYEDIIDYNNKDLTFWTDKHNKYASREVLDVMAKRDRSESHDQLSPSLTQTQAHSRRWVKDNVYAKTPLFVRPFLYFIYRYFLRLGFLDGKEGLIFHFLQGFWYRFLVDAKIFEYTQQQRLAKK
ncbi:MAG: glycosyltransferase family 2 protein [Proteobacteria bacterium]|nr:glycosyltransferase family 2 protein [Pseudomonadota bacterium]